MFTGIIEDLGIIIAIKRKGDNIEFQIQSGFTPELKPGQSVSHNGVCLTVTRIEEESYFVTAVEETLNQSNLGRLKTGDFVNLERAMLLNGRFDGHIVQGHVDQTGICTSKRESDGSYIFEFEYQSDNGNFTVRKGSICVNGVSLTVVDSRKNKFTVAVIPYTLNHTNLKFIESGDMVNLEFDILGKYIKKLLPH